MADRGGLRTTGPARDQADIVTTTPGATNEDDKRPPGCTSRHSLKTHRAEIVGQRLPGAPGEQDEQTEQLSVSTLQEHDRVMF